MVDGRILKYVLHDELVYSWADRGGVHHNTPLYCGLISFNKTQLAVEIQRDGALLHLFLR